MLITTMKTVLNDLTAAVNVALFVTLLVTVYHLVT